MADASARIQELLDHAGWLQELARRLVGEASADDVVQEVWLRAARRPPEQLRSPRGWLKATLRSAHLRLIERREAAEARERIVSRDEALPSAAELAERAEAQRWLVEAVLLLEEPQRRTLLLHFFEGLSAAEIARRCGLPSSTIRTRIGRGLGQLRDRLDTASGGRSAWLSGVSLLSVSQRGAFTPVALTSGAVIMWKLGVSLLAIVLLAWTGVRWVGAEAARDSAAAEAGVEVVGHTVPAGDTGTRSSDVLADAAADEERIDLEPASAEQPVEASVPPKPTVPTEPGTVTGRVLDPNGQPVSGATVFEGTLSEVATSERFPAKPRRPSADTDEDGRFVLELGEPRGVVLCARAEGFAASEELALDLVEASPSSVVTLQLRTGASVWGVVYGKDQQPLSGRLVQVASPDLGEFRKATTDDTGRYELRTLNPGPWRAATYPSEQELRDAGKPTDVGSMMSQLQQAEFVLKDGEELEVPLGLIALDSPRVTGVLLHDGKPISGLMQWYPAERPTEKMVSQADAKGQFEIDLPGPGSWIVHANVMGSSSRGQRRTLELDPGVREVVEIDLRGSRLSGRVVDAQGAPVAGVDVEVRAAGGAPHQPAPTIGSGSIRTDDEGRYEFELLRSGTYVAIAHGSRPGAEDGLHGAARTAQIEVDGAADVEAPDLEVQDGVTFDVLVSDATGRPISGASLFFHDAEGWPLNPLTVTRSSGAGEATSPAFALGPIWVTAMHGTGASMSVEVDVGADESVDLEIGGEHWIELDAGSDWIDPANDHVAVFDSAGRQWGGLMDIRSLFEAKPTREVPRRPLFGPFAPGTYSARVERGDGSTRNGTIEIEGAGPQVSTLQVR